jgi:predicted Fe-Mo cluster-binding NifX family protein
MRIAIASDDGTTIAGHTGRCRGFAVYEVLEGRATRQEYRENVFTAYARGQCEREHIGPAVAAHHSHAQLLSLLSALGDCCALITRGMGARLVADLAAQGIDAYVCSEVSVDNAAREFASGGLPRLGDRGCCNR